MSVESHRAAASDLSVPVQVLVVSSTRSEKTDRSGARIVELLGEAGHTALGRVVVDDDVEAIRSALTAAVSEGKAKAVILTGGTGLAPRDLTPEAVEPLFTRKLPGFGELFRMLSHQQVGSAAMLSRATGGVIGGVLVFALPGSVASCELAMQALILPELRHLVGLVGASGAAPAAPAPAEGAAVAVPAKADTPVPSGRLGRLGQGSLHLGSSQEPIASPPEETQGDLPAAGWKRAVWEIGGQVAEGKWEDLPEAIENLSPVVDVLHKAGERRVMTLPNGRKYSIFGYPDLQRPTSKVLAIGWGQPLAEVIALHRWPVMTGVCIEGTRGLLPPRTSDVGATCEAITGRAPRDLSGEIYAVQGDTVWVQRDRRVVRWDGRKEFDDGTPNQVLASLVLHWSQR